MNAIPLSVKMNEIVNKFLLVGDTFMPEMHLKQPGFTYYSASVVHSQKIKKELKSLCKLEIQILFIEINLIKLVFNMIWVIVNQKI